MFIMNRDGFSLLVMGFTGKNAMKFKLEFIGAFNEMERKLKAYEKPKSQIDIIIESALQLKEQEARIESVENKVKVLEAKTTTRPEYFTIVGYGTLNGIPVNLRVSQRLGQKATKICKEKGIPTDEIPDPKFGKVKMYPKEVLEEVFAMPIN